MAKVTIGDTVLFTIANTRESGEVCGIVFDGVTISFNIANGDNVSVVKQCCVIAKLINGEWCTTVYGQVFHLIKERARLFKEIEERKETEIKSVISNTRDFYKLNG